MQRKYLNNEIRTLGIVLGDVIYGLIHLDHDNNTKKHVFLCFLLDIQLKGSNWKIQYEQVLNIIFWLKFKPSGKNRIWNLEHK